MFSTTLPLTAKLGRFKPKLIIKVSKVEYK